MGCLFLIYMYKVWTNLLSNLLTGMVSALFKYLWDSKNNADNSNPQQVFHHKEGDVLDTTLRRRTRLWNSPFAHRNHMKWRRTWHLISRQTFECAFSLFSPQCSLFTTQQESGTASWFVQLTLVDQSPGPSAPQHLNCNMRTQHEATASVFGVVFTPLSKPLKEHVGV